MDTIGVVLGLLMVLVAAAWLVQMLADFSRPLEPIIRWVQRVFFGIDRPRAGVESLVGKVVEVETSFAIVSDNVYEGWVNSSGERWSAISEEPFRTGDRVEIVEINGLTMRVRAKR